MVLVSVWMAHGVLPKDCAAYRDLMMELTGASIADDAITIPFLRGLIARSDRTIFIARTEEGRDLVGMAMLIETSMPMCIDGRVVDTPFGLVENVARLPSARGARVGDHLMGALIERARERGLCRLDLTSRSSRTDAHELYTRHHFARRDTDVFRLTL